jgi:hypothetical protein
MSEYTVVLIKMMSQVQHVEAVSLKEAVAKAMDLETLQPDSGNDFDAAGDTEVQAVELGGEEVWSADRDSEDLIF